MSPTVSVTVWGEYALFTRPELSVERLSYPFMSPSAARGVLDAILFKPQMRWHVRRITALRPRTFPHGVPPAAAWNVVSSIAASWSCCFRSFSSAAENDGSHRA